MANHVRTQIRDAFITALTGLTTTGARVYPGRVHQMASGNIPGLIVLTPSEEIDRSADTGVIGTRKLTRQVTVIVEGYASTASNVDTTLDTISKEVETAIANSGTFSGLAKDVWLQSTEKELDGSGENRAGVIRIEYLVITRTVENAPDAAIA